MQMQEMPKKPKRQDQERKFDDISRRHGSDSQDDKLKCDKKIEIGADYLRSLERQVKSDKK